MPEKLEKKLRSKLIFIDHKKYDLTLSVESLVEKFMADSNSTTLTETLYKLVYTGRDKKLFEFILKRFHLNMQVILDQEPLEEVEGFEEESKYDYRRAEKKSGQGVLVS